MMDNIQQLHNHVIIQEVELDQVRHAMQVAEDRREVGGHVAQSEALELRTHRRQTLQVQHTSLTT